jgi:hypothetical protein
MPNTLPFLVKFPRIVSALKIGVICVDSAAFGKMIAPNAFFQSVHNAIE